ncbi:MAG: carotenoid oxygenase family protein, partial [Pseudomonadales bacterium]
MKIELVQEYESSLPPTDDHPYRTGAWQPNVREYNAFELEVEGELPDDLSGVYVRNSENPLQHAIGRYHPFDGDGMLHALCLDNGVAEYRNRFVRTDGFLAEPFASRCFKCIG